MTRKIFCQKLGEELEALPFPPFPGELGQRIFNHISQPAWKLWLNHQTMLINENRWSMTDPAVRERLRTLMEKFLFHGEEISKPDAFVPLREKNT